jgi:hypothetical protein
MIRHNYNYNKAIKQGDNMENYWTKLDKIQKKIHTTMEAMRNTTSNEEHKALTDKHYDLIQQKRQLQANQAKLVRELSLNS